MAKVNYKKEKLNRVIADAQKGDIKALEELIKRVQKQIYSIFYHLVEKKEDISDLTQEVLLKLAKSIGQLKDPKKFKSWLNQIITNHYYDFIRKNDDKFLDFDEDKIQELKDKLGCEPGEKCLFSELEKLVRVILMSLPNDLRIVLVLREFEGLSYEEIAKMTNTAIGTVKSRISRARMKMQKELKEFI